MSIHQHILKIHSVLGYAGMFPAVTNIQEALALVIRYQIKAEIIGQWLYCFPSPLIGCQLEAAGFWYSFRHKAYVYTGTQKEKHKSNETLNEIRARLGNKPVKATA
jgi:hypothetical protein